MQQKFVIGERTGFSSIGMHGGTRPKVKLCWKYYAAECSLVFGEALNCSRLLLPHPRDLRLMS